MCVQTGNKRPMHDPQGAIKRHERSLIHTRATLKWRTHALSTRYSQHTRKIHDPHSCWVWKMIQEDLVGEGPRKSLVHLGWVYTLTLITIGVSATKWEPSRFLRCTTIIPITWKVFRTTHFLSISWILCGCILCNVPNSVFQFFVSLCGWYQQC